MACEFTCRENLDQGCPLADGKTEIKRSKKLSKGVGHLKVRKSGDETTYKPWRPKAQRSSWTGCLLEDDGEAGVLQGHLEEQRRRSWRRRTGQGQQRKA